MAHRQEEAENHWPGFVDALSTIVMVVTFLLIILGVVIFVIAQQIKASVGTADKKSAASKEYFESPPPDLNKENENGLELEKHEDPDHVLAMADEAKAKATEAIAKAEQAKAEQETAEVQLKIEELKTEASLAKTEELMADIKTEQLKLDTAQATAEKAKSEAEKAKAEAEKATQAAIEAQASAQAQTAQLESQKIQAELKQKLDGKAAIKLTNELRQDRKTKTEVDGQKVVSKEIDDSKKIAIATDDTVKDFKANIVQSADAILTLIFDSKSVTIDQASSEEITKFLTDKKIIQQQGKIEIRSYVNLNQSSMGERRRLAFYRAMAARNELLTLEVDPSNISIKVKEVDDEKLAGILKIYIKP